MALGPIKDTSVVDQAVGALTREIFELRLPPGLILRELELARKLNVSQTTVRAALARLELDGLVTREKRQTSVTNLTRRELEERVEVRKRLEVMAFEEVFLRKSGPDGYAFTQTLREDLSGLLDQMRKIERADADFEFHRYIWRASGSQYLAMLLHRVTMPLFAVVKLLIDTKHQSRETRLECHETLAGVLLGEDPRAIPRALDRHMERAYRKFRDSGYPHFQALWEAE